MFLPMTARASVGARTEFGPSRWIDRWLAACRDLAELERSNPMSDAVVEEIDGRMIRIGDAAHSFTAPDRSTLVAFEPA